MTLKRWRVAVGALAALLIVEVSTAATQAVALPSRTQCKQWDDAYIGAFDTGFWVCGLATLVLALTVGLLGRISWTAAAPRLRILVVAVVVTIFVELGLVVLPWTLGFGWLWFSSIDTSYFDCIPMSFGAEGFFSGLVGAGVAAIAQWPTMVFLLMIPAAVAGLLAWLVSELAARFFGLPRRARKEGA